MKRETGFILFIVLFFIGNFSLTAEEIIDVQKFRNKLENIKLEQPVNNEVKKIHISTFANRYVISPGDSIDIFIFGEPDADQRNINVKSDGYINVHPLGEIKVAGFNVDQVKNILTAGFKKYFIDPIISVHINTTHIPKIYIFGAIQKPGLYQHFFEDKNIPQKHTPPTLISVITKAGGVKYNADLKNIKIINRTSKEIKKINLFQFLKNGDSTQDLYLNSGDTVFIPNNNTNAPISDEDFLLLSSSSLAPAKFPIRVRGAVKQPGVHMLSSISPGLNTAIAASQGFTFNAEEKAVKIHRVAQNGQLATIIVNPSKNDLILRPNDIIDVYDKRKSLIGKSVSFFNNLFGSAKTVGSAYSEWDYVFDPSTDHNIYMK